MRRSAQPGHPSARAIEGDVRGAGSLKDVGEQSEETGRVTHDYVLALAAAYPGIREVWLFGSRADGSNGPDSDYDYLACADENTLRQLAATPSVKRDGIDLLVVFDGDNCRSPWKDGDRVKGGSLKDWDWRAQPDGTATYKATKELPGPEFAIDCATS